MKNQNLETEFRLESLRVSTNFAEAAPIQKGISVIPVRRPDKQVFMRVNDDPAWSLDAYILDIKSENEQYIVIPELASQLANEVVLKRLFVAVDRQGGVFVWPIRLPNSQGKIDDWNRSAMEVAEIAKRDWVRIESNQTLKIYEPLVAMNRDNIPEPEWPEDGFEMVIERAFKDRIISTMNHPVLMRLRGEV